MKILLVDDVPVILDVLHKTLERPGVEFDRARTCREAFGLLKENSYDWVTLDIKLPDGSGLDILEEIRANHSHTRVVVISSEAADPIVLKQILSLGADGILVKPPVREELLECIYKNGVNP